MTAERVRSMLESAGYRSNPYIDGAVWATLLSGRPLLVEGDPGTGKTYLAYALAKAMGTDVIRVQMYEGLTDDKLLYDYDYQRQLLTIEALRPKVDREYGDLSMRDAVSAVAGGIDFYGEEFLIRRPILRSIDGVRRHVLLIDEMDKAPEEVEYMLYEFLEQYSVTVPQYGNVSCPPDMRPVAIITSNGYRDLSDALRRRCNYLYIPRKTVEEMLDVLTSVVGVDPRVAEGVAKCMVEMGDSDMRHKPGVSEAVEYATLLSKSLVGVTREVAMQAICSVVKDHRDATRARKIVNRHGDLLWGGNE